jgi:hypothetical protein
VKDVECSAADCLAYIVNLCKFLNVSDTLSRHLEFLIGGYTSLLIY